MSKIILTKKEFKTLMEVIPAAAKDETRPILQYIHFNNNEVVALDGYRMKVRRYKENIVNGAVNIHRDELKKLMKSINKDIEKISIEFTGGIGVFELINKSGEVNYTFRCILVEGRYINYRSLIIDTEGNTQIRIENIKEMINIIKPLRKNEAVILDIYKSGINISDVMDYKDKITKRIKSIYGTRVDTPVKADIKGDNLHIAFNNTYIKEALKDYSSCNIKGINSVNQVIIQDKEKTKLDLILPVRLINKRDEEELRKTCERLEKKLNKIDSLKSA